MRNLIDHMCRILNFIKCFTAGYTSAVSDQMMIDYGGKRYMVTFEELCNIDEEEMVETMHRYWKLK